MQFTQYPRNLFRFRWHKAWPLLSCLMISTSCGKGFPSKVRTPAGLGGITKTLSAEEKNSKLVSKYPRFVKIIESIFNKNKNKIFRNFSLFQLFTVTVLIVGDYKLLSNCLQSRFTVRLSIFTATVTNGVACTNWCAAEEIFVVNYSSNAVVNETWSFWKEIKI